MSTSRNDKNRVVAFAGVPCQLPGLRQGPTGPVFESWQEQGCQARICPSPDLAAYILPLFTWAVTTARSPVPPSGPSLPWHRALPPHLLSGHCMPLRSPAAPHGHPRLLGHLYFSFSFAQEAERIPRSTVYICEEKNLFSLKQRPGN